MRILGEQICKLWPRERLHTHPHWSVGIGTATIFIAPTCGAPTYPIRTPHLDLQHSPSCMPQPLSHRQLAETQTLSVPDPGKQLKKSLQENFLGSQGPPMNQGSLIILFQAICWVISHSPPRVGQSLQERARRGEVKGKGDRSGLRSKGLTIPIRVPGKSELPWLELKDQTSLGHV